MGHLCYVCFVCFILSRLFIAALGSPAGKGLTSWLLLVMSNCDFVTFQFGILGQVWYLILLVFAIFLTLLEQFTKTESRTHVISLIIGYINIITTTHIELQVGSRNQVSLTKKFHNNTTDQTMSPCRRTITIPRHQKDKTM